MSAQMGLAMRLVSVLSINKILLGFALAYTLNVFADTETSKNYGELSSQLEAVGGEREAALKKLNSFALGSYNDIKVVKKLASDDRRTLSNYLRKIFQETIDNYGNSRSKK